ncbi:hypothetical protein FF011L_08960 [Roseimaritima multifibrata]|uniref:Uncharacterized protein n=1 Tax=Roseimaritima multifibrata TaxID=1930274 RepID=A0A517MBA1_9BACT|nr:hypothetical protein [Roseimaritima multifibrata]QDS92160.1 hypothetical protein FF011L_08960 [Roseimaritima multifibrata]
MQTAIIVAFNLSQWFNRTTNEVMYYFSGLSSTQWGILSACAVTFGFLCMRSNDLRKR